ncbi:RodZ domain-containing protein [Chryseomicrobium sp. FSL W7-1435]|uniref:helix-turn-helix domain-containing protein n=1 Tax=Chryseomicrobium sp. FSL W7-1435 TaxID=2921704 RepID=UPI00315A9CA5
MSELGARLRQARTDKNLSIEDIQALTKIQKRYLHGIEEGNYESMPGPFYVRAFVRQYAEAVGLNGDEIIEQYRNDLPVAAKTAAPQMAASTASRRSYRSGSRAMEIFPMILVALFVVAILAIAYLLSQRAPVDAPVEEVGETEIVIETQQPESTPAGEEEEETEESVEEETEAEPESEVSITPTGAQGEDSFYDVTGTESLTIRIDFSGDSWLSIQNQAREELLPVARVYTAEDASYSFEVPANGTYRVRVGVTSAAQVFVNDTPVEFQTGRNSENLYFNWSE